MKLLIAFDGSESSCSAIADLQLAGLPADTEAVVLAVLDTRSCESGARKGQEADGPDFSEACAKQLEIAEQGVRLAMELFPTWRVTPEVRVGSPAWEIIRRAEGEAEVTLERAFDLVVVGSRGHGELKRMLFGSVAHRVVTTCRGSVRVSRGRPERLKPEPETGVPAPPRVMVGVDGSKDSQAAVEAVASRDWPRGTRVVVATFETGPLAMVRHWEPSTIWGGPPLSPKTPAAERRPALRVVSEAEAFVRRLRPDLIINTLVQPADPKYALISAGEEWNEERADCIFVGASGTRGLERFLLGSVSTSVAMNAACSVEVVRHRDRAG